MAYEWMADCCLPIMQDATAGPSFQSGICFSRTLQSHLTYWSFRIHVLIRVTTSAKGITWDFLFSVPFLNNFLILQFSSRPVNKHVVYNTCQGHHPEKRSCLSPGCHFRLKGCYTVPRCGLCGPRSVSKTWC